MLVPQDPNDDVVPFYVLSCRPSGEKGGRNHPTQTMINICPVAKDLHIGWESSQKGGKVKKRLERVLFRLFFFGMLSTLACHPLPHTHYAAFLVPRALSL